MLVGIIAQNKRDEMTEKTELLGHPVYPSKRKHTLTDQVYEILLREILAGRWRIGDRLPSALALAKESGLSTWPLQKALEALRDEGYLDAKKYMGYYLRAINPSGKVMRTGEGTPNFANRTIGLAVLEARDSSMWALELFHRLPALTRAAEARNYKLETRYLKPDDNWADITCVGKVFSRDTLGVISLYPFPHSHEEDLRISGDRMPFVYLGSTSSICLPVVCSDTNNGFYRLTRKIIGYGHREIIFMGEPEQSPREVENRYMGYERAMKEAGLEPHPDAHEESLNLAAGDLRSLRAYLERWSRATAIVATRFVLTEHLIAVAEMMGRHVPNQLSVAGFGPMHIRPHDKEHEFVRLYSNPQILADSCIDLLEQQAMTCQTLISRVLYSNTITDGHSLAPPPGLAAPDSAPRG